MQSQLNCLDSYTSMGMKRSAQGSRAFSVWCTLMFGFQSNFQLILTDLRRLIKPDILRYKPLSFCLGLNQDFHKWQEFAGCKASVCHPFQCQLWRPKTRLGDHQMIYFYVPFCFSAPLAIFHSMLTFIIQSPLPGGDYIGYLRSSRPSPGLPHNDVQIFPFPVPPSLALRAHFCTHGPISIS